MEPEEFDVDKSKARSRELVTFQSTYVKDSSPERAYQLGFVTGQRELYTAKYEGKCPCLGDTHQTHCRYYRGVSNESNT